MTCVGDRPPGRTAFRTATEMGAGGGASSGPPQRVGRAVACNHHGDWNSPPKNWRPVGLHQSRGHLPHLLLEGPSCSIRGQKIRGRKFPFLRPVHFDLSEEEPKEGDLFSRWVHDLAGSFCRGFFGRTQNEGEAGVSNKKQFISKNQNQT